MNYCQTCHWWRAPQHIHAWPPVGDGQCRKRAPQMIEGSNTALWPITSHTESCGEHRHDAEKWSMPYGLG